MSYLRTLRLFFSDGVINEYRVRDTHVEFRTISGRWRILSDSDIELHYRFKTDVAQWLRSNALVANPQVGHARA